MFSLRLIPNVVLGYYQILVWNFTYYTITDRRILIQKGLIGKDFYMIDFDQITNAEVNVGLIDRLFGGDCDSIFLSTAGTYTSTRFGRELKPHALRNVSRPYEVFRFLKEISHAVKTDIQFPNLYRPDANPSYDSEYRSKRK